MEQNRRRRSKIYITSRLLVTNRGLLLIYNFVRLYNIVYLSNVIVYFFSKIIIIFRALIVSVD